MAVFGKRSKRDVREEPIDPEELRRAVDDGLLIARSAITVAVANRIILTALQQDEPFDPDEVAASVREELDRMADEQTEDALRVRDIRAKAQNQTGRSRHQHDYRRGDDLKLRTREATYRELADGLVSRKDDDEFVDGIVLAARERAWGDIGEAVVDRLRWAERPREGYEIGRDERVRAMLDEDFAALVAEHAGADRAAGRTEDANETASAGPAADGDPERS